MITLGIDTSNYTTSVAFYDSEKNTVVEKRKLLHVKSGELGLRQADAFFQNTVNLPVLLRELCSENSLTPEKIGVSVSPCEEEGSYMPCFMSGKGIAESLSAVMQIPVCFSSHQAGHITAAVWSAGRMELLDREFLAFHVSGGTTQAVKVTPDREKLIKISIESQSLDLKAGQAVDRVGKMLGISFPAGKKLDELSLKSNSSFNPRPFIRDGCCSLSGLQNQCEKMYKSGGKPEDIARFCIEYISAALSAMTRALCEKYPDLPIVYSGGVMSNTIIRERFTKEYGAVFAKPAFSSDNAVGTAILASLKDR